MPEQLALDVAVLPPPDVTARAIVASAALPEKGSQALRLAAGHLPHVTLTQLFARANEMEQVLARVDETLRGVPPLALRVTGGGQGASSVWMAIERTPLLVELHEALMEALRGLERPDGGTGAFFGDDARVRDVLWVTGYRLKSSFGHYTPHITLGHGSRLPSIEPFSFTANTVAVCHLGRFCACRRIIRHWTLTGAAGSRRS